MLPCFSLRRLCICKNVLKKFRTEWSTETHTTRRPTEAFGKIEFAGFGSHHTETRSYARVDYMTPPEHLWTLLTDIWNLPIPKLVLSVTGGARQFFMKPRLLNAFKQGLIDIASSTGASLLQFWLWVLDNFSDSAILTNFFYCCPVTPT